MKKILITITIVIIATKIYASNNSAFSVYAISDDYEVIDGNFNFGIKLTFNDTIFWSNNPIIENSEYWNISQNTNLIGQTYLPNQQVIMYFSVQYNTNQIPFLPATIKVKFSSEDDIETLTSTLKIYFTPYNTIEIWDLLDYTNLPRRWHNADEHQNPNRVSIEKSAIPVSDLDINYLEMLDFSENPSILNNYYYAKIDGLAYDVIMLPIENETENDTLKISNTFTGRVEGILRSQVYDELDFPNNMYMIPLKGIEVRLYEKDLTSSDDLIEIKYTDENGEYFFDYNFTTNELEDLNKVELYVEFVSKTDFNNDFKIYAHTSINYYKHRTITVTDIPETNLNSIILNELLDVEDDNIDATAFLNVHFGRNAYNFFATYNLPIVNYKFRIGINNTQTANIPVLVNWHPYIVINQTSVQAKWENLIYHEIGHALMYSFFGEFIWPCYETAGEDAHGHAFENNYKAVFYEAWADFIFGVLDRTYWFETNEFSWYNNQKQTNIETNDVSRIQFFNTGAVINNGLRSEFLIGRALYDLWDGANNMPQYTGSYLPGFTNPTKERWHPFNDYTTVPIGVTSTQIWSQPDDIELDFGLLCQPFLQASSYHDVRDINQYFNKLTDLLGTDYETIADVGRCFRENFVMLNITTNQTGINTALMSTDEYLFWNVDYNEGNTQCPINNGTVYVDYLNGNGLENREYYIPMYYDKDVIFTDPIQIGITDNEFTTSLYLNKTSYNLTENYFMYGINDIDVRNGLLQLGYQNNGKAHLSLNNKSLLRVCNTTGNLEINSGSSLTIQSGASLIIEDYANVVINGTGKIVIKPGAYVCISPLANITFETDQSYIQFQDGYLQGANPLWNITTENCGSPMCGNTITKNNSIAFENNFVIYENTTLSNKQLNFRSNLEIKNTSILELNNCELNFYDNCLIDLKNSDTKLILNNTTISSTSCNDSWEGIKNYGQIEVNNSVIEDYNCIKNLNNVSKFYLNNSILFVDNLQYFKAYGELKLTNNSEININTNGTLQADNNTKFMLNDNSLINFNNLSYCCLDKSTIFEFNSSTSKILLNQGFIKGVHPNWDVNSNCSSFLCNSVSEINYLNNTNLFYDYEDYVYYSDEPSWNNVIISINGTLTIPENQTLTISNNSIIKFSSSAKIEIHPGGKLIIENSTLINSCTYYWQGIQILGNNNLPQSETNQGVLEMSNSTIENASCGILVGDRYDITKNGGIIKIEYSEFLNNSTAIEFRAYHNICLDNAYSNKSFIKNTQFVNSVSKGIPSPEPELQRCFIKLYDVDGVQFSACEFLSYFDPKISQFGILSYNSSFSVSGICNDLIEPCPENQLQRTTFENLTYPIYSKGTGSLGYLRINKCEFKNNLYNVTLQNVNNALITSNNFTFSIPEQEKQYGISLEKSTSYRIKENNFVGTTDGHFFGIVINNSGEDANEIYKNNFENLYVGAEVIGINGSTKVKDQGLQFICNSFSKNSYHIYIHENSLTSSSFGSNTLSAGNIFSPSCKEENNYSQIYNLGNEILYFYDNFEDPDHLKIPFCSNHLFPFLSENYNQCNTSTPQYIVSDDEIYNIDLSINQKSEYLDENIDEGDTEGTVYEIITANPGQAQKLKNNLIRKSPWLSDTSLISTIIIESVLPPVLLRDILVVNPRSAKSKKVLEAIENRTHHIPQPFLDEILAQSEILSEMEAEQSNLGQLISEKTKMINQSIAILSEDKSCATAQDILVFLEKEVSIESYLKQSAVYLSENQFEAAKQKIDQISADFEVSSEQISDFDNLKTIINLKSELYLNNLYFNNLTDVQKTVLNQIATNSETISGSIAESILEISNDTTAHPIIYDPIEEEINYKTTVELTETEEEIINPDFATIFPNPASEYIVLQINEEKCENLQVEIYDISGKFLIKTEAFEYTTIDLKDFIKGTYILKITENSQNIYTSKFVIEY